MLHRQLKRGQIRICITLNLDPKIDTVEIEEAILNDLYERFSIWYCENELVKERKIFKPTITTGRFRLSEIHFFEKYAEEL